MTTELAGGLWNARRDRDPELVRRYLRQIARQQRLDFVLLQEFSDYLGHLARHPIDGWRLVCPVHPGRGDDQNPILVRDVVSVERPRVMQMTDNGWWTVDGKPHAPVYSVAALLDGWLRVASIHAPVSVSWSGGQIAGPPQRVEAYLDHTARCARFARYRRRHPRTERRTLLGGDWNARTWERGRGTPADLAHRAGLTISEPAHRAGPGHDGIDYVLSDANVFGVRKHGTGGSDHPFVTFVVRP